MANGCSGVSKGKELEIQESLSIGGNCELQQEWIIDGILPPIMHSNSPNQSHSAVPSILPSQSPSIAPSQTSSLSDLKAPSTFPTASPSKSFVASKFKNSLDESLRINLTDGNTTNGNGVSLRHCDDSPNQKWYLDFFGYIRSAVDTEKCLEPGSDWDSQLQVSDCLGQIWQQWDLRTDGRISNRKFYHNYVGVDQGCHGVSSERELRMQNYLSSGNCERQQQWITMNIPIGMACSDDSDCQSSMCTNGQCADSNPIPSMNSTEIPSNSFIPSQSPSMYPSQTKSITPSIIHSNAPSETYSVMPSQNPSFRPTPDSTDVRFVLLVFTSSSFRPPMPLPSLF